MEFERGGNHKNKNTRFVVWILFFFNKNSALGELFLCTRVRLGGHKPRRAAAMPGNETVMVVREMIRLVVPSEAAVLPPLAQSQHRR